MVSSVPSFSMGMVKWLMIKSNKGSDGMGCMCVWYVAGGAGDFRAFGAPIDLFFYMGGVGSPCVRIVVAWIGAWWYEYRKTGLMSMTDGWRAIPARVDL